MTHQDRPVETSSELDPLLSTASGDEIYAVRTRSPGPAVALPLDESMLQNWASGDLFGLSQDAGMGWEPSLVGRKEFLILSTSGGIRATMGRRSPWDITRGIGKSGCSCRRRREEFKRWDASRSRGICTDPCDGRTQGTTGMMDSLPYRNDAATVFRRLIRSLPRRAAA